LFRKIKEITFKLSPYCNLKCEYCFQKDLIKEDKEIFDKYDDLISFIRTISIDDQLQFKLTGGETSLICDQIEIAYKKLKKIERYVPTRVFFTTITNGTNLEGIINLMSRGILESSGCKLSWDGIYSASRSRKPKNIDIYSDEFFNNKVKLLGKSKFRNKMLVRIAITPNTISSLSDSVLFLLENGCTKFEYYYLTDCEEYRDVNFINEFKRQLEKISILYTKYDFDYYNWNTIYFAEKLIEDSDKIKSISCRHLGKSLYINMNGYISPCGFFSDDCVFDQCKLYIGDLKNGLYRKEVEGFINEYSEAPMCNYKKCNNMQCFECPATNKHRTGRMNNKLYQCCELRTIEKNIFLNNIDVFKKKSTEIEKEFHYFKDFHRENLTPDYIK